MMKKINALVVGISITGLLLAGGVCASNKAANQGMLHLSRKAPRWRCLSFLQQQPFRFSEKKEPAFEEGYDWSDLNRETPEIGPGPRVPQNPPEEIDIRDLEKNLEVPSPEQPKRDEGSPPPYIEVPWPLKKRGEINQPN